MTEETSDIIRRIKMGIDEKKKFKPTKPAVLPREHPTVLRAIQQYNYAIDTGRPGVVPHQVWLKRGEGKLMIDTSFTEAWVHIGGGKRMAGGSGWSQLESFLKSLPVLESTHGT